MPKIQLAKNGQYRITIPNSIALAMELKKGDILEFIFDRGDLILKRRK